MPRKKASATAAVDKQRKRSRKSEDTAITSVAGVEGFTVKSAKRKVVATASINLADAVSDAAYDAWSIADYRLRHNARYSGFDDRSRFSYRMNRLFQTLATIEQTRQESTAIPLSAELHGKLADFARSRGTDIETLVRVATATLLRAGRYYALDTVLAFGKYVGETMETVIRLDPGYVHWLQENTDKVCLAEEASLLLDHMLKETAIPQKVVVA